MLTFDEIMKVANELSINVNFDDLYEEFCVLRPTFELICARKDSSVIEKWNQILKNGEYKNMLKIIQYVFSIYGSNADTERVFSLCAASWRDDRNKLLVDHAKAELQIKTNFAFSCKEFYNYVLKNKQLLKAAKSEKKYTFLK